MVACSRIQSRRASASSHLTPLHFGLSGGRCNVQSLYTYTNALVSISHEETEIRCVTKGFQQARVVLFGCAAAAGSISRPLTPSPDRARAARDGPCTHTPRVKTGKHGSCFCCRLCVTRTAFNSALLIPGAALHDRLPLVRVRFSHRRTTTCARPKPRGTERGPVQLSYVRVPSHARVFVGSSLTPISLGHETELSRRSSWLDGPTVDVAVSSNGA
jgi:hypothetical protein